MPGRVIVTFLFPTQYFPAITRSLATHPIWFQKLNSFIFKPVLLLSIPIRQIKARYFQILKGVRSFSKNTSVSKTAKTNSFETIAIQVNKTNFKKRAPVVLNLKNNSAEAGFGTYSISVTKKEDMELPVVKTANNFSTEVAIVPNVKKAFRKTSNKGTVVQGNITNTETNTFGAGKDIALSIPGKDFVFKVTTTDAAGNFNFVLDGAIEAENALLQVLDETPENFKFTLQPEAGTTYDDLKFDHFIMDASLQDAIRSRSISNQIENAYYSVKPDTITAAVAPKSFVHYEEKITYDLDDYTRFPSLEETFVEYVTWVSPVRNKEGERVLKTFQRELAAETKFLPLLFIDGVFVRNHTSFLAMPSKNVETIKVVQRDYKFGTTEYQGVVLLETIKKDFGESLPANRYHKISLFKPQARKNYYKQRYESGDVSVTAKIPDYRHQLAWEPALEITTGNTPFSFYTSDVAGTYEITLEGFTNYGKPVSIKKLITVE